MLNDRTGQVGQSAIASAGLRPLRSLHVSEGTVKENVPKTSYMVDLPPQNKMPVTVMNV